MADPNRNAAIWYADDGYDPDSKGLNGRRVAGASFLDGFFRHADVDEVVSLTQGKTGQARFADRLRASGRALPHRAAFVTAPLRMAPVHTLYYPSPNFSEQCWLRQRYGMNAYAICGITHTTATRAVMQGVFDMRAAPQAPWDAVICTSRAVHAAISRNMQLADAHLEARFGALPPRPLLPVIPLGIDCAAHAHDPAARAALRRRMGWGEADIVVATLSRLLPYGKFDPGPLFLALQAAQAQLPDHRLHMLACGLYADTHSKTTFEACARAFMPDVSYTHLDGADATARSETLSGADIFTFPIDNIQETFGLAPVEAMAAGLPVITSDWDGMRDTVTQDVGIRIPTLSASARHTAPEGWRHLTRQQSYAQYGSNVSALTALDLPALTRAFVDLAQNPDTRRRMGKAGLARARSHYDWSAIIPQMQDLWAEQSAMRAAAAEDTTPRAAPMGPSPMDLFADYPTAQLSPGAGRFYPVSGPVTVSDIYTARRYGALRQSFETEDILQRVQDALAATGEAGSSSNALAEGLRLNPVSVERACLWLVKYGLARHEAPS